MQAILRFPDCVDPNKLTDYTYAAAHGGYCPSNMKRMPSLRFSIRYDTRKAIPQGWKGVPPFKLACGEVHIPFPFPNLTSLAKFMCSYHFHSNLKDQQIGDGYCFHGDFINGWYEDAAKNMLKATGQTFLRIDGAHGMGKQYSSCAPKDADPGNGTSDYLKSLEMMGMRK